MNTLNIIVKYITLRDYKYEKALELNEIKDKYVSHYATKALLSRDRPLKVVCDISMRTENKSKLNQHLLFV